MRLKESKSENFSSTSHPHRMTPWCGRSWTRVEAEVDDAIKRNDMDNNGTLDFEEFVDMFAGGQTFTSKLPKRLLLEVSQLVSCGPEELEERLEAQRMLISRDAIQQQEKCKEKVWAKRLYRG